MCNNEQQLRMKKQGVYLVLALILCCNNLTKAQTVKDFFYIEKDNKVLPVFVRGNLDNNTIVLYVQGGPGETAIDFGRSDYRDGKIPWKEK